MSEESTPLVNSIVWSGQCHAKHAANATSVHQRCTPATDRLAVRRCPISCSQQGRGRSGLFDGDEDDDDDDDDGRHRSNGIKAGVACTRSRTVSDLPKFKLPSFAK